MLVKTLIVGQLQTNCYLLTDKKSGDTIIVDPGDDADYIENNIRDFELKPIMILATHGHFDHILSAFELQQAYGVPFLIHKKDEFLVKKIQDTAKYFLNYQIIENPPQINGNIKEGQVIKLGKNDIKVIETPGHTPGGVSYYCEDDHFLFSGDTLFCEGGVGRTEFKYASEVDLKKSLEKLFRLPHNTKVFSGHGELTTIGKEKQIHKKSVY